VCCSVLQCVTACCNVLLHCVAVLIWSIHLFVVVSYVAECCIVLQCVAACVFQCVSNICMKKYVCVSCAHTK